jgi:hypothetical protein
VAVRSKVYVCNNWIDGIRGWIPAEGMEVRLFCLLCVVWVAASATVDYLLRGDLTFVCVCVCV